MNKQPSKSVSIRADNEQAELTKGQKAFNRLIKQIETKRAQLQLWQSVLPEVQNKFASELRPLLDCIADLQRQMVLHLDRLSDMKGWKRAEREAVADLLCDVIDGLLERGDDAELQALYEKHQPAGAAEQEAEAMSGIKDMLEGMLGVEFGDDTDLKSPDDILRRAQEKLEEKFGTRASAKPRQKTAKQLAKEEKQQAEAQQAGKTIREVYRKLVSALHPDREPDPAERDRKTELMKRVNAAHKNNNLLQLLELQMELEHIDQASINNISEDRLGHYNRVLKEQLAELSQELARTEMECQMQFAAFEARMVTPTTILKAVDAEKRKIKRAIAAMKKELQVFDDAKATKAWVKELTREAKQQWDELLF